MPIFIKTEKFKDKTLELSNIVRKKFLLMHKEWGKDITNSGHYIRSGYLINEKKMPGGGGLLIVEVHDLTSTNQEQFLKDLIIEYHQKTKSPLAQKILSDWSSSKKLFKIVVPPSEKNKVGIEEALEKATI